MLWAQWSSCNAISYIHSHQNHAFCAASFLPFPKPHIHFCFICIISSVISFSFSPKPVVYLAEFLQVRHTSMNKHTGYEIKLDSKIIVWVILETFEERLDIYKVHLPTPMFMIFFSAGEHFSLGPQWLNLLHWSTVLFLSSKLSYRFMLKVS